MRKFLLLIVPGLLLGGLSLQTAADVPPEPGYRRVTQKLVIESPDEIPGYRFFIRSGADLREVLLKKGGRQTIDPLGGGAWYRVAGLFAVPAKNLAGLAEVPVESSKLSEMEKAVYEGKVPGMLEILTHNFVRDVRVSDKRVPEEAVYRIETDAEKTPKAVPVAGSTGDADAAGRDLNIYSTEVKSPIFWATVAGASLTTLALISLGVWYVRRSKTTAA